VRSWTTSHRNPLAIRAGAGIGRKEPVPNCHDSKIPCVFERYYARFALGSAPEAGDREPARAGHVPGACPRLVARALTLEARASIPITMGAHEPAQPARASSGACAASMRVLWSS